MKIFAMLVSLSLCGFASAGDFRVVEQNPSGLWVEYTGTVEADDHEVLKALMELVDNRYPVYITINSPGGSAYGGIFLYHEAEKWDNLITIAGSKFGAWSAAAVFWLGSPRDFTVPGSQVGFHAAYCNPWFPPGCDTSHFQALLKEILYREGFEAERFNATLNFLQDNFGVDAWLILTCEGWNVTVNGKIIKDITIPRTIPPITKDRL